MVWDHSRGQAWNGAISLGLDQQLGSQEYLLSIVNYRDGRSIADICSSDRQGLRWGSADPSPDHHAMRSGASGSAHPGPIRLPNTYLQPRCHMRSGAYHGLAAALGGHIGPVQVELPATLHRTHHGVPGHKRGLE